MYPDMSSNNNFMFPKNYYSTMLKYQPGYVSQYKNTGWTVYELTAVKSSVEYKKYWGYTLNNATMNNFYWHPYNSFPYGIQGLGYENKIIGFLGDSIVEGYGSSDYNGGSVTDHSDH